MPALNLTHLVSTTTTNILQSASSNAPVTFANVPDVLSATTSSLKTLTTTLQTSKADTITNANSSWSIPVIVSVILATFAIFVGLPSAVLAIRKLRRRP
jgi:hypothetical protein